MNRTLAAIFTIVILTAAIAAQDMSSITSDSAGPVKLGMTIAQAEAALPGFTFKRTSDGEGVAWVEVSKGSDAQMYLYAGEEDPEAAINKDAAIQYISVVGKGFRTAKGVAPGMTLSEAEKHLGKVKEITMSEIESREYATFGDESSEISYRLQNENNTAGNYSNGERTTSKFNPGTSIYSIDISAPPVEGPMDGSTSLMDLIGKAVDEFSEMSSRTIEIKAASSEESSKLTVTVIDDGYMDDSVRGKRTILNVEQDSAGVWRIKSSSEAWRCYKGRGHTDFSPKPCI